MGRLARSGELMSASRHCTTAGAEAADGGAGREDGRSVPGGGGRCHCVGGVNRYGTQTLTKEESWGEIQAQGASRKVAPGAAGEGESRKTPKGGEWCWLKIKISKSLAGKPGNSLQHG